MRWFVTKQMSLHSNHSETNSMLRFVFEVKKNNANRKKKREENFNCEKLIN